MVKTIVASELGTKTKIAESFGVQTVNTLTGFKFIAEKIAEYELTKEKTYLFGYEESYGYHTGDFVRDKDAVQIALLTAEMAAYYSGLNMTLFDALYQLYKEYRFYKGKLISLTFEGIEGQQKITSIMEFFRKNPPQHFAGVKVSRTEDYIVGEAYLDSSKQEPLILPKSNVLKYILEDGSWVCIRPSGTELKCKIYIGAVGTNENMANEKLRILENMANYNAIH